MHFDCMQDYFVLYTNYRHYKLQMKERMNLDWIHTIYYGHVLIFCSGFIKREKKLIYFLKSEFSTTLIFKSL